MHERRIQERRNLIYYLEVFEQTSGRLLGRLVDITAEGMMLISDHQLPPMATFSLRMQLPQPEFEQTFFEFSAQSVWCRPDVNPNFFDTGFEFRDLTEADRQIIASLVAGYGFPHPDDRLWDEISTKSALS